MFDKDSSGFIDAAELKTVLQTLKQNPTDKDVEDMIAELDKNGGYTVFITVENYSTLGFIERACIMNVRIERNQF